MKCAKILICPDPNDEITLEVILTSIVADVRSWMSDHDEKFREEINSCLEDQFYHIMYILLCRGEESMENIEVLRKELLLRVCERSDDLVCKIMIICSEPNIIKPMIKFLEKTKVCSEESAEMFYRAPASRLPQLEKRQYDLATLYKVYVNIFCTRDEELIKKYEANEPGSLEGLTSEIKTFIVLIRFKGPFCCIADLGAHHVGTS